MLFAIAYIGFMALVIIDAILFCVSLRNRREQGISWAQWDSNKWRFWPGGGIYQWLKFRK